MLSCLIALSLLLTMCLKKAKGRTLSKDYTVRDELCERLPKGSNDAELIYLRHCFFALDEDRSGVLEMAEVATALKFAGREPSNQNVLEIMREFDLDSNGNIVFEEFVRRKHSAFALEDEEGIQGGATKKKKRDVFLEVAKQLMARSTNTHIYLFLMLTFLVLVSTSNTLFQLLKCHEFVVPGEESQRYLYIDYSVDCLTDRYRTARVFVYLNILICK